ncbi:MAG: hypothetical protein U1D30_21155 [Planctomycetota bacterium]
MSSAAGSRMPPGISAPDPVLQYRPVSAMAVICFCMSLLTPFAFAHHYFWVLPALVLPLSIWTSIRIEKARAEYAGQLLAKAAIVISLASGIGSVTKFSIEWVILSREARQEADRFLDLILANRLKQAFVLTIPPHRRADMENDVDQLIQRNSDGHRKFLLSPIVEEFKGKAADVQVTFQGFGGFVYDKGFHIIGLHYYFTLDDKQIYRVSLAAFGGVAPAGEWKGRQWYVSDPVVEKVTLKADGTEEKPKPLIF